jgi:hypothetical protein
MVNDKKSFTSLSAFLPPSGGSPEGDGGWTKGFSDSRQVKNNSTINQLQ